MGADEDAHYSQDSGGGAIIVNGYMNASSSTTTNDSPPIILNSLTMLPNGVVEYVVPSSATTNDQIHIHIDPTLANHIGPSSELKKKNIGCVFFCFT